MKKLILLFLILSISIYLVNSEKISGTCSIKTSCDAGETALFSLYEQTDSHVKVGLNERYKVCCPNIKVLNGTKGSQCANPPGREDSADLLFKAYNNVDSHVSNAASSWQENVCLSLSSEFSGSVQCTIKSSCDANELGVVSLYQVEDSHVGSVNDYLNKVCCSVNYCPAEFQWDPNLNRCVPIFEICLLQNSDGKVDQSKFCKSIWRQPLSQTEPYWDGALTPQDKDCFEIDNEAGCCFAATYLGDTYGRYVDNTLIKKSINEIFGLQPLGGEIVPL